MEITDSGGTILLKGEQVDKVEFLEANEKALEQGLQQLGGPYCSITKRSADKKLYIRGLIQETTRVLTEASTQGKKDSL